MVNNRLLIIGVAIIITLRLAFVFLLPFGQTTAYHLEGLNDEPAHYNYVKYLSVNHAFPVLKHWVLEKDAFVCNEFEYHQAPLYYLLCVPFYLLFGEKGALVPCRLLCALFGLLSVWIAALIVSDRGFPQKAQFGAALFTGLLFSQVYFSSLVSNDAMSWLLALMVTRELLKLCSMNGNRKVFSKSIVVLTSCCTAGLLTKSSFLFFLPIILGVFVYKFYKSKKTIDLLHSIIVPGLSCLAALPWYARNMSIYHSITGMPASSSIAAISSTSLIGLTKGTIKYLWYPMQNLAGGTTAFAALTLIGAAIVLAHCAVSINWMVRKNNHTFPVILLALLFLVNAAAAFWYYLQWQNPEARFLFPAIGAIVFFMIVPVYQLFEKLKIGRLFIPYVFLAGLFPYGFLVFAK
jgi:uncharacterized membrane protein